MILLKCLLKEELTALQQDTEPKTLFENKAKAKNHYNILMLIQEK